MGKFMIICVCVSIVALDTIAVFFGWKAQEAQNQVQPMNFGYVKPCQVAYDLGLTAASLLVIAHVLANIVGVYSLCTIIDTEERKRNSIVCLVLTWIYVVCGVWFLVHGVLSNRKSRASCGSSYHQYLSMGSGLSIGHATSALILFVVRPHDG